jgi:hypothetical protein
MSVNLKIDSRYDVVGDYAKLLFLLFTFYGQLGRPTLIFYTALKRTIHLFIRDTLNLKIDSRFDVVRDYAKLLFLLFTFYGQRGVFTNRF